MWLKETNPYSGVAQGKSAHVLRLHQKTKRMPKRGARSLQAVCARKVQRYLDLKKKLEALQTKELGTDAAFQPHRSQNLRLAFPGEIPHEPGFIGFASPLDLLEDINLTSSVTLSRDMSP